MKIIQSFWTKNDRQIFTNDFRWHSPHYYWLGWILSTNQLRKFYSDVELYTDTLGYEILIEKLNLPFTKVHVVLDDLNSEYLHDFWAIAKIKAYSLQEKPFLHIDGDVFIWEKFNGELEEANLVAQNHEITTDYYRNMWDKLSIELKSFPECLLEYERGRNFACNMGVFGGNNIDFINRYTNESFNFVKNNLSVANNLKQLDFNIFFEQVLFGQMLLDEHETIKYVIDDKIEDFNYQGLGNFDEVPFSRKYLHVLGDFKRDLNTCKMLESYVLRFYPKYFQRLVANFPNIYKIPELYNFTLDDNEEIIKSFNKVKKQDKNSYLLARDLSSVDIYKIFYENINKESVVIVRLDYNYIVNIGDVKGVEVENICSAKTFFSIDFLDEIILDKITPFKEFGELKKEIIEILDDDAKNMKDKIIILILDKIKFYLKHKMISIIVN